jgi:hypothetical protein
MAARLKKPAYGMNDAPRRWWNKIDAALRSYGVIPTRADRCCYVAYKTATAPKPKGIEDSRSRSATENPLTMDTIEAAMDLLMDPVAGSPSKGKYVVGVICLHVDDLLIIGSKELEGIVLSRLRHEFQVGSEGKTDVVFTGQHVKRLKDTVEVDQFRAIEELVEIEFDKALKDDVACTPALHTSYRSVLGSLNWLQSRTQYQICYRFPDVPVLPLLPLSLMSALSTNL